MRRTMFVVPDDLAPVVQAACTDAIAARERTRLVKRLQDAGVAADAGAWLAEVERGDAGRAARPRRGGGGRAVGRRAAPADVGADGRRQALRGPAERLDVGAGAALDATAASCAAARGDRGSRASTAGRRSSAGCRTACPSGTPRRRRPSWRVATWRPSGRPRSPTCGGGRAGPPGRRRPPSSRLDTAEVDLGGGATGVVLADDLEPVAAPEPWVALLPALDPTPMGWSGRAWFLGDHGALLFDRSGNVGPTVWADGRIVGGWAQRDDGEIAVAAAGGRRVRGPGGGGGGRRADGRVDRGGALHPALPDAARARAERLSRSTELDQAGDGERDPQRHEQRA